MPNLTREPSIENPRISLIVAVAENDVIGNCGQLPWRLPSDLKRFRERTLGKPVIMGRKTYESIGKPLDGRQNVVITQVSKLAHQGVWTVPDIEEAIGMAKNLCHEMEADEIMVMGGAQVYKAALPHIERIYLTRVHASPDGDAFFEPLEPAEWQEGAVDRPAKRDEDDCECSYIVLERCAPAGSTRKKFKRPPR